MKKIFIPLLLFPVLFNLACKPGDKKPKKEGGAKTEVDSLLGIIEKGHVDGMGRIGRLHNTRNAVQAALDSISKLPASAQQASKGFTDQLTEAIRNINYADTAMEKWMREYKEDSAIDNEEQRILYLKGEVQKVESMSAAIKNSIAKGDSLIKPKL